jgi:hypothetical protein
MGRGLACGRAGRPAGPQVEGSARASAQPGLAPDGVQRPRRSPDETPVEPAARRGGGPTCRASVRGRPRARPAGWWPPLHAVAGGPPPGPRRSRWPRHTACTPRLDCPGAGALAPAPSARRAGLWPGWVRPPGRPRVGTCWGPTVAPGRGCRDRAAVCGAHALRRRGGTDDGAAPPAGGRPPEGAAGGTDRLPPEHGVAPTRRGLARAEGRGTPPAPGPQGGRGPRGTVDGGRSPARSRRARVLASRRWGWPRAPGVWGRTEGAATQQTGPCGGRARERQDPQGPASSPPRSWWLLACSVRRRGALACWRVPRGPRETTAAWCAGATAATAIAS